MCHVQKFSLQVPKKIALGGRPTRFDAFSNDDRLRAPISKNYVKRPLSYVKIASKNYYYLSPH